jgi:hypothetical protein
VDLRGVKPSGAEIPITATAILGAVEVIVPEGWRVSLQGAPILGALEDKRRPSETPGEDAPHVRITAFALLGGVELKGA